MRAVGVSDLDLAARAVMAVPRDRQTEFAAGLLEDAHVCDLWRKRFHTAHISGGTGSLYRQASLYKTAPQDRVSWEYCNAFSIVLQSLEAWRTRIHSVS